MSRRRLEEAILLSKGLEIEGESAGEGLGESNEDSGSAEEDLEKLSELFVRRHIRLNKDVHSIYAMEFSANGKHLAVGFGNGVIQIVDVDLGNVLHNLSPRHRKNHAVTAINFHPKSQKKLLVAAGADGFVSVYDIESELNVLSLPEDENEINALDFSMDGSVFATAGKDKHIRLYDSQTNQILNILRAPDMLNDDEITLTSGHSRRIFALKFHPTEYHTFLTGGWDDSVKVWDKRMAKEARRVINGPHICGPAIDIKDDMVLTGSWVPHNALQLWDLGSSRHMKDIPFPGSLLHGEFLYAARFFTPNTVIAGGSGTCGASAVDYNTDEVVGEVSLINKAVQTVEVAHDRHIVAVAGVGGNLHIAELS